MTQTEAKSLGDYHVSARFRDVMRRLAQRQIDLTIPSDEFGTVTGVDLTTHRVEAVITGTTTPVSISYSIGFTPQIGDTVRITGRAGSRYVVSGAAADATVAASTTLAAMQHAEEAIALAQTTPLVVLGLGDSILEGATLSSDFKTWFWLMGQNLSRAAGIDSPGIGYCCAMNIARSVWTSVNSTNPQPIGANGIGRRSWESSVSATNDRSLAVACDRLKLFFTKGPTYGKIQITLDGVVQTSIDCHAASLQAATWDSGALTLGTHTLRIDTLNTGTVTTYAASIAGAFAYVNNFSAGVQMWNGGHSFSPSWTPLDIELQHIAIIDPDLVLLEYGANDPDVGPLSPAQTRQNFIDTATAITATITAHKVSYAFMATWGKYNTAALWGSYIGPIRDAATTVGATFIDVYSALGQRTTNISDPLSDGAHPNSAASYIWRDVVVQQMPVIQARGPSLNYFRVDGDSSWRARIGLGFGGAFFFGFNNGTSPTDLMQWIYDPSVNYMNIGGGLLTWKGIGDTSWRIRMGMGLKPFIGFSDGASAVDGGQLIWDNTTGWLFSGANVDFANNQISFRLAADTAFRMRFAIGFAPYLGFSDGSAGTDHGQIIWDDTNLRWTIQGGDFDFNGKLLYLRSGGDTKWRVRIGMGFSPFVGFSDGSSGTDDVTISRSAAGVLTLTAANGVVTSAALTVGTALNLKRVTKSANYTTLASDCVIEVTANSPTITLVNANTVGQVQIVANSGAGTTTVAAGAGKTLNGPATVATKTKQIYIGDGSGNWT